MRPGHGPCGLRTPAEIRRHPYFTALFQRVVYMDSWYVSLVPASVAVAIIGYSLFIAYA